MNDRELKDLLLKYGNNTATEDEKSLLESWYLHHQESELPDYTLDERLQDAAAVRENLKRQFRIGRLISLPLRISAAACVLILLGLGGFYLVRNNVTKNELTATTHHDIPPGQNKAVLALANGQKIYITGIKKGIIYRQGALQVTRNNNGVLAYTINKSLIAPGNADNQGPAKYNTLSTPRGGQSSITLADGTVAYLDAQSSVRFPVDFSKSKERRVEVTGQVYFDVRHNASKPFRVDVKGQTIEDIGTVFNINAYDDEPVIKTTLISGGIKITRGNSTATLRPGQQAITVADKTNIRVKETDTEEVTAWKNGYFLFNNEKLESIMRKISRWYDVDIVYPQDQNTNVEYWGSITRYDNVSKVLKMLEITGDVKFRIEGKKIFIEKK